MRILAGDIGGTKTILSICEWTGNQFQPVSEQTFVSQEFNSFYDLLNRFLTAYTPSEGIIQRACFAVAGPVIGGQAKITNLPWVIDEKFIAKEYSPEKVKLVNDFLAIGHALPLLNAKDLVTLQTGTTDPNGVITILGAGTGLGMCMLIPGQSDQMVLPSEAGSSHFAPGNPFEADLTQYLLSSEAQVCCEDILSGAGLHQIYNFLRDNKQVAESPVIAKEFENGDAAQVIASHGLMGTDSLCETALHHFVSIYGTQASNFALVTMATGGMYIAGGIAPKIIEKLKSGEFVQSFLENKKMRHILKRVPLQVILNPKAGLLGAINIARQIGQ